MEIFLFVQQVLPVPSYGHYLFKLPLNLNLKSVDDIIPSFVLTYQGRTQISPSSLPEDPRDLDLLPPNTQIRS